MNQQNNRRKRRRKPTLSGRFGSSTLALEIGLIRMTMDMQKELERKQEQQKDEK